MTTPIPHGYKLSPVGVIPSDWEVMSLEQVLSSTQLGGNYPNSEIETEYPLIKMGNLGRGYIEITKAYFISAGVIPSQNDKLNVGDLLFNTRNTLELVGKIAIWRDELPIAFFNSNIMRLVFTPNLVSSNFFMNYILNTRNTIYQLKGIATGTTSVAAIYTRDLIKVEIPLPPKAEQTRIATALSDTDALITALERLIVKKRMIKHGAMQELLRPKEGWEVKRLGEIVDFNPSKSVMKKDEVVTFLGMEDVSEEGKILRQNLLPIAQIKKGLTAFNN
jgi:type I restriction enzyme S subunit